jgi:uncharacterized membrane protein
MAIHKSGVISGTDQALPKIRDINRQDLIDALHKGLDDFLACPSHLVLLALIYPVVGLLLARLTFHYDILPLLFPIITGFALVGPLAAVGLYEISRHRELHGEVKWKHAFDAFNSHSISAILALGFVQLIIYLAWLAAALVIYRSTFGSVIPTSIPQFVDDILTTNAGWTLIIVGCGVGFLFAAVVLTISVVSFPMLVDRDVGAMHAIQTSIQAVTVNPVMMATWGIIVVTLLVIGMLPFFVGLAVVMPVLGHATWHLYRRVVEH